MCLDRIVPSSILCWSRSRIIMLAIVYLAAPVLVRLPARADEETTQPRASLGEKAPRENTTLSGFKQWLSDASCVSCHFQVPKQGARAWDYQRQLEAAHANKGYLIEHHLAEVHKQKTGPQCTVCHMAGDAPQGECTRGEGCLRDAGKHTKVTYLGVSVGAVPEAVRRHVKLPTGVGLMIESVEPGSPAAEHDLRTYDILERLDQQILVNEQQFSALIKTYRPGDEVAIQLIRASEPKTLRVKLGVRVVEDSQAFDQTLQRAVRDAIVEDASIRLAEIERARAAEQRAARADEARRAVEYLQAQARQTTVTYLGINTSTPPDALVEQLKLTNGFCLLIDSVEPGSPAAAAGLRPFDVLEKLDDQLLVNSEQLTVLIRNHRAGEEVELSLRREGRTLKLRAKLGEHQLADAQAGHGEAVADVDNDGELDVRLINDRLSEAIDLSTRRDVKDDDFIRRVYLDLVGTQPPEQEITRFAVDQRPSKRQRLIDALLSRPEVVDKLGTRGVLHWSDSEHSLMLTTSDDGHRRLLARDLRGNVVFDGPVDSDDQRRQLDRRLAAKLSLMVEGLAADSPPAAAASLEKIVSRFEAHEQPLDQLLDLLRRETGANIVVDRKRLAAAGVNLDEPLSLELHDVRAGTVLKTLLVLAGGPKARLNYEIEDGVVLITIEH